MSKRLHLYDFEDYKAYLRHRAEAERGVKSALAKALNCQSAYISQVLNENAHLSLEQGDAANTFFAHSEKESQYFLLLLQQERAGTVSLKKFFANQLKMFRGEQLSYLDRKNLRDTLTQEQQAVYYSSWEYNVIHMAVAIPRLRTKGALLKAFRMSESRLNSCLEFLLESGLVHQTGDTYTCGTTENYLDRKSPFLRQLHINTRTQAIHSFDRDNLEDAHYSMVITISRKDVVKIKKLINEYLGELIETARPSKEEAIYGLTIDFFDLEKDHT